MKRKSAAIFLLALLAVMLLAPLGSVHAQAANSPLVLLLKASGPLSPSMASYIQRGIGMARDEGAELIILQLDTPGGEIDLMNRIVQDMRASTVPIVVYVAPNGAMAGSAGTLLTLAGHLDAMAPETAIGAASPVDSQGQNIESTLDRKIKDILEAQARALAERRGPQAVALAQDTIEKATAVSASEALDAHLVDFIADNVPDLLRQLDGQKVEINGQTVVLHTQNARLVEVNKTILESALDLLTNPNIVFLLLAVGVQALLIELSNPGAWVPGFVGAVSLLLAIYGMGVLPVNWVGLVFVLLAFVLFILDIKAPTHGALTVAGTGSFIAGALVLFNTVRLPGFPVISVPLVVATAIFLAAIFFVFMMFGVRAQRMPVKTGIETYIGRRGLAMTDIAPKGRIRVFGEQWTAELAPGAAPIKEGGEVEVADVEGLHLIVKPPTD